MSSICPRCSTKHNKAGRFCSRSCANSRDRPPEVRAKISAGVRSSEKFLIGQSKRDHRAASLKGNEARAKTHAKKMAALSFDDLKSWETKRKRVIAEQEGRCNSCGLNKWLGQPLVLEIEHKNGDNRDNQRENLEGLCPNCHSLTDTWRGRNKSKAPVADEALLSSIAEHKNTRQALLAVGLAGKGGNYKRVKELLGRVSE